jgi:phage tail sheath protein FI
VAGFFANGGSRCQVLALPGDRDIVLAQDLDATVAQEDITLVAAPGFADPASQRALIDHAETTGRFAVLDGPDPLPDLPLLVQAAGQGGARPPDAATGHAAIYLPWIEMVDPVTQDRVLCPPSGHVCGAIARNDAARGVWKAPANIALHGALRTSRVLDWRSMGEMTRAQMNPLLEGRGGVLIWGARTLAPPQSAFRYVPVRRLMSMLQASITRGLAWTVVEPQGPALWTSVAREIRDFLHSLYQRGALVGAMPDEAYFVRCDRSTMTQNDIDAGRLVALVGVAPIRPSEFVMLRFELQAGGAS